MKRYAMDKLVYWKNKRNRKPLILKGARQVGKTWLMKEFGKKCFKNTAYINFDSDVRMRRIFEEDYDIQRIIRMINIETGERIIPEETLIIFDEVQEAPRAISSLKYFCENAPEYAVVSAGSLLGVAIHEGVSFPVGKVESLNMYPMSFREFLTAMGEEALADIIEEKDYQALNTFSDKYINWLKLYYFVGGMPEAVNDYAECGDVTSVRDIQKQILELYENDFSKHTPNDELARIRMVWNSIPLQLAKENKKFFFGQIRKGARAKDFELAIEWLQDCGLAGKVYRVEKPGIPLKAYTDFSAFKIYLLDVGLLGAMSDLDARSILEKNELFTEFKGALTEQYVYQQIISETEYTPYYFSASSHTEIDFLIQKEGQVIPLEVKAEENVKAKSLKAYFNKYNPPYAVRTSMMDYRKEEWMVNIPLYAISSL
ncbi:MAG TPA: ATP-binding protein [Candidatus Mediterraneibacter gallistercoris]|uniref:ATP-binding protein n=1 Tax=Candidatus Mediterraneibacter gallistercoris TaxID=2838671 RepID=A0A9D2P5A8_9FIRM|nr:ATP-binding protein [Candidatus Mediterraneibacter gallistercoris]